MIYPIDPWTQLWICRLHQRTAHRDDMLTATVLRDRLTELRQGFLGTGMGLTMLVHDFRSHRPNMRAVDSLSRYLGKRTAYFLSELRPEYQFDEFEETATTVMYFGLLLYAYDTIGQDKLDDLIRWAECYAESPEVMSIVVDDNLPEDLSEECREFVAENEIAPSGFVDAATAAVAVLTGAIYDPFGETI